MQRDKHTKMERVAFFSGCLWLESRVFRGASVFLCAVYLRHTEELMFTCNFFFAFVTHRSHVPFLQHCFFFFAFFWMHRVIYDENNQGTWMKFSYLLEKFAYVLSFGMVDYIRIARNAPTKLKVLNLIFAQYFTIDVLVVFAHRRSQQQWQHSVRFGQLFAINNILWERILLHLVNSEISRCGESKLHGKRHSKRNASSLVCLFVCVTYILIALVHFLVIKCIRRWHRRSFVRSSIRLDVGHFQAKGLRKFL